MKRVVCHKQKHTMLCRTAYNAAGQNIVCHGADKTDYKDRY